MAKIERPATAGLALDARSLDALKQQARRDQAGTIRQATRQFEAQFAQMLLGQLRQSSMAGSGPLAQAMNSPASQTWRGMLDQQLAQKMAGLPGPDGAMPARSGLGLADMLEKQLTRQTVPAESVRRAGLPVSMSTLELARGRAAAQAANVSSGRIGTVAMPFAGTPTTAASGMIGGFKAGGAEALAMMNGASARRIQNGRFTRQAERAGEKGSAEATRAEFLGRFLPAARKAEAATGIPAAYILGQAALESGWGRREIRGPGGEPSRNLFGVKATGWSGRTVTTRTTEYENGVAQRVQARFRAYDSYEQAFEDYARLLASNPRYEKVLNATSAEQFAQGLQRAGYATDPRYAEKLRDTIRYAMQGVI